MVIDMVELGRRCQVYRQSLAYRQIDVARDLGYEQSTISRFEQGKNDNARILMWYVIHGFDLRIHIEGRGGVVMRGGKADA